MVFKGQTIYSGDEMHLASDKTFTKFFFFICQHTMEVDYVQYPSIAHFFFSYIMQLDKNPYFPKKNNIMTKLQKKAKDGGRKNVRPLLS